MIFAVIGWVLVILLALICLTRVLRVDGSALVAVSQDGLPILLGLAWIVAPAAFLGGRPILGVTALVLVAYHVAVIVPRVRGSAVPHWVGTAPRLVLGVANVYVENRSPEAAARQLVESGADVLVVLESTPTFRTMFDRAGGGDRYPHRVFDPDDHSEYAASIYARRPPVHMEMISVGELAVATAIVPCGPTVLHVLGVIPTAIVEVDGYRSWRRQIHELARHLHGVREPMVVAGDLNSTTFRSGLDGLYAAGFVDAHESLGLGLKPSFKLSAEGLLGRIGPLVRLDHALVNRRVHALAMRDLADAGSDHRPFLVTLAVRPPRSDRLHRRGDRHRPTTGQRALG